MTEKKTRILSCLSSFVFGVGVGVGGYRIAQTITNKSSVEIEQHISADNGGMLLSEETADSSIKLMSAKIAPTAYAENGISPQAESAYTLTATVEPANAFNKKVDWSIKWNASGAWCEGKTVTDYATITPASDGALTANLSCLAPFGNQIIVECMSRDNASAKATCTVDYQKKVSGLNVTFKGAEVSELQFSRDYRARSFVSGRGFSNVVTDGLTFTENTAAFYVELEEGVGTISAKVNSVSMTVAHPSVLFERRSSTKYNNYAVDDSNISTKYLVGSSSGRLYIDGVSGFYNDSVSVNASGKYVFDYNFLCNKDSFWSLLSLDRATIGDSYTSEILRHHDGVGRSYPDILLLVSVSGDNFSYGYNQYNFKSVDGYDDWGTELGYVEGHSDYKLLELEGIYGFKADLSALKTKVASVSVDNNSVVFD